jgi:hypothetical protein
MKIIAVIAAGVVVPVAGTAGPAQGAVPTTFITVNGNGGARVFDGVGAILGGGGNARYLEEYPAAQRAQILQYLFKPGYGASLQLLKLEIGGDGNSSDARGKDHPLAVRILARAWLYVIWDCWHNGVAYDPALHRALQRLLASQDTGADQAA